MLEPVRPTLLARDDGDFALGVSASSLVAVRAARGGLWGGDGSPVEGTSGIPLGPCETRSAVMETLQRGRGRVGNVAAGEDIGLADDALAIITTMIVFRLSHGRHGFGVPDCWFD